MYPTTRRSSLLNRENKTIKTRYKIQSDQTKQSVSMAVSGGENSVFDGESNRKTHKPVQPSCDCEFQYRDYIWKRFSEYVPSRNGVDVRDVFVVKSMSGKEVFTYAEGAIGGTGVETRFPFLCGEIVSSKKLASAGKLKNLYAWVQSRPDETSVSSYDTDGRPLHVLQRQQDSTSKSLTSLPLVVEKHSKVVVFRTHGGSLFVQLMPTVRSEERLVSGTPLFDRHDRGVRASVGSMFSEHEYVVNCAPTEYCEIPIGKNTHGSDRLNIVCLDRRGLDSVSEDTPSKKKRRSPSLLTLVSLGLNTVTGGGRDRSMPTTESPKNTLTRTTSVSDIHGLFSNECDTSGEYEVIYRGVVNDRLQVTDTLVKDKKNKPPKSVVTITIDDDGICVRYSDETERLLFTWVHKDPGTSYGVMPRRYFDAKANVVEINTAARDGKRKAFALKRFKSLEHLI